MDQRWEVPREKGRAIVELLESNEEEGDLSKAFPTTEFGFRKVRIERPLRLKFEAMPERIERLKEERAFQNLAKSRKRGSEKREKEIEGGKEKQERILTTLQKFMGETLYRDREAFRKALDEALEEDGLDLKKTVLGNIENVLGERTEDFDASNTSNDTSGSSRSPTA